VIKFPQELDSDEELHQVEDEVDDILAAHHNALKEAIKALEVKVGIDLSAVETSLDYIIKQLAVKSDPPTGYHKVYGLYAKKTGDKYHPVIEVETEPEGG